FGFGESVRRSVLGLGWVAFEVEQMEEEPDAGDPVYGGGVNLHDERGTTIVQPAARRGSAGSNALVPMSWARSSTPRNVPGGGAPTWCTWWAKSNLPSSTHCGLPSP